jgi:thiamine kinase-like enzyme
MHLGALIRTYHDAAASFPWTGREWLLETRQPVETVCHNEVFPWNTVFRAGVPVAFIDWDTAAPGPRAWDLGFIAWHWVPFWHDELAQAAGLPIGVAEKSRRFRLLLDAYGIKPDINIVHAGIERMQGFLAHMRKFAADGSEWEMAMAQRGVFDEMALSIDWVNEHVAALVGS